MINPFETIIPASFLTILTATAALLDLRTHKIPNTVTFPAMLMAIAYFSAVHGWDGMLFSMGGAGAGVALLLLPYIMGGMGAGDAKLMGAVGACLGAERTLEAFLIIALMGCLYAVLVIVFQRRRLKGYYKQLWLTVQGMLLTRHYIPVETVQDERPKVYYGVAIGVGTLAYLAMQMTSGQLTL